MLHSRAALEESRRSALAAHGDSVNRICMRADDLACCCSMRMSMFVPCALQHVQCSKFTEQLLLALAALMGSQSFGLTE
jgi:hypothetical protein